MNVTILFARGERDEGVLEHYAKQSPFSAPGRHSGRFDELKSDPASVASTVQA